MYTFEHVREQWAHPTPQNQTFFQENFHLITPQLLQLVLESCVEKDHLEITSIEDQNRTYSCIGCYRFTPVRQIEVRCADESAYQLIISFFDHGRGLLTMRHLLSKEEIAGIPEELRTLMLRSLREKGILRYENKLRRAG